MMTMIVTRNKTVGEIAEELPMADPRSATEIATATEQTRQAITRYATAWAAGDRPALLASYHEGFILYYFGRNPLAGVHRGKAAALAILAEVTRRANRQLLAVLDIMAGPHRGGLLVRERFDRDGKMAEVERLLIYSVREGLLGECWVYDQDQAAIDHFLA
jgi:ketosteroid isomerase-like protein